MISFRNTFRNTAALCAILTAGFSLAGDGVVRMSDRSAARTAPEAGTGVVKMTSKSRSAIQKVSFEDGAACGDSCTESCAAPVYQPCPTECWTNACDPCATAACCPDSCNSCNTYFASCDASGMPSCWCQDCQSSPCQCYGGRRRNGHNLDSIPLFAQSVDSGTGSACRDGWRGQSMSFRNKNARLAEKLFGWMIPSACVPPVGKYQMTYADQPGYIDSRDTQLYGAQGYGMPMTVPLAPNVYHSYNYSAGLPASRVTTLGNYNPATDPQRMYHQSW